MFLRFSPLRLASLQKRTLPPNNITLRQSIPSASFSSSSQTTTAKKKKQQHSSSSASPSILPHQHQQHHHTSKIARTKDDALFLLSLIPRDGITVQKLSEKFFASSSPPLSSSLSSSVSTCYSFERFSSALDFLRQYCYEILRFHRISGQGREKLSWAESTSTHDDKRLGLDCVRNTFSKLNMSFITEGMMNEHEDSKRKQLEKETTLSVEGDNDDITDATNDCERTVSAVSDNEKNVDYYSLVDGGAEVMDEKELEHHATTSHHHLHDHHHYDHNNDRDGRGNELADEFIDSLRRDLRQEREARINEERENKRLRRHMMSLLKLVSSSKIVVLKGKKKSKRKQGSVQ